MLMILGTVVGLAFFYPRHPAQSQRIELFQGHDFTADDLAAMQVAFAARGLADFQIDGKRVLVPRAAYAAYAAALKDGNALPTGQNAIRDRMGEGGFLESDTEREVRWNAAKEQMLENLIRRMDGVDEAFVMIGRGRAKSRGIGQTVPLTMTVAVRSVQDKPLMPRTAYAICEVVAGGVAGLDSSHVTVTDLATSNVFRGGSQELLEDERFARLKTNYEQQWNEKVRRVLHFIPQLDVSTEVLLKQRANEAANPVVAEDATAIPDPTTTARSTIGWVPERIAVTVSIPRDYLLQVWRARAARDSRAVAAPTTDDLRQISDETDRVIERAVAGISPLDDAVRLIPEARVIWFDAQRPDVAETAIVAHRTGELIAGWLADSRILIAFLVLLSLVGFSLAWGVAKDLVRLIHGTNRKPVAPVELRVVGNEPAVSSRGGTPPVTNDQHSDEKQPEPYHAGLTELVREDPQAAVSMLKSWLSKAG